MLRHCAPRSKNIAARTLALLIDSASIWRSRSHQTSLWHESIGNHQAASAAA